MTCADQVYVTLRRSTFKQTLAAAEQAARSSEEPAREARVTAIGPAERQARTPFEPRGAADARQGH